MKMFTYSRLLPVSFRIFSDMVHRVRTGLEKYLNGQDCVENSLKIKFALKST